MRKNNGITLVALVITIVVLLILAAVTIRTLESNGVIGKAKDARNETENAKTNDIATIDEYIEDIDENTKPKYTITLMANGGTLPAEQSETFLIREGKQLGTILNPSKIDNEFCGWYTSPSEGIKVESTMIITKNITIYAQWKINKTKSFVGYYADTDGDTSNGPEGVIYVDLLKTTTEGVGVNNNETTVSGTWNSSSKSTYSYTTITESKAYEIRDNYTGSFGTHPVISLKSGSTGNDRFYVMALNDIGSSTWNQDYSSNNYSIGTEYIEVWPYAQAAMQTAGVESIGKRNTGILMQSSDLTGNTSNLWSKISTQVSNGWHVPSRAEWSAFGDFMYSKIEGTKCNTSNYSDFGLCNLYWSSSQSTTSHAWCAYFSLGVTSDYGVSASSYMRLAITF